MLLRQLILCVLIFSEYSLAAIEVVDDGGDILTLERPAKRIISLAPSITEVLFYIGAGAQVVGADEYSNYPSQANEITRVNNHAATNYELILSLKPDLVIAWQSGNGEKVIGRIRELGLPVFVVETSSLQEIPSLYKRLGQLSGRDAEATLQANHFSKKLDKLYRAYYSKPKIRLFYQTWDDPLMTLNGDHLISHMIALCGGINLFADAVALVPYVNIESVLSADPQIIISGGNSEKDLLDSGFWRKWTGVSAVKNQHLYAIPSDLLQRHSGRILEGTHVMCEYIDRVRRTMVQKAIDH